QDVVDRPAEVRRTPRHGEIRGREVHPDELRAVLDEPGCRRLGEARVLGVARGAVVGRPARVEEDDGPGPARRAGGREGGAGGRAFGRSAASISENGAAGTRHTTPGPCSRSSGISWNAGPSAMKWQGASTCVP